MEYINLRKLNQSELKQVRSQVVRLIEKGMNNKQVSELIGVRPNRISEIRTAYKQDGAEA